MSSGDTLLSIRNLSLGNPDPDSRTGTIMDGLSLTMARGETLGVVGQSGSGKTMLANAILGMLPAPIEVLAGQIQFDGADLVSMTDVERRAIRGGRIGVVLQNPMSSFNPSRPVGAPLVESLMRHSGLDRETARRKAATALGEVGIPDPEARMRAYPHQFSGGQLQRIMIALAMINDPELVIADEPTTALDATVQVRVLRLLQDMAADRSLMLITHDLGVASALCDNLAILKDGRMVESGAANTLLRTPQSDYAKELIASVPTFTGRPAGQQAAVESAEASDNASVVSVDGLTVDLGPRDAPARIVEDIALQVDRRQIVALVGESGSGKSTIAKALVGLAPKTSGSITASRVDKAGPTPEDELAALRKTIQLVFQNGSASMNPRWSIRRIITEPLLNTGADSERREAVLQEALATFDLPPDAADRRPSGLSGGQRQRVALARALVAEPELLVADEPLSAVDVLNKRNLIAHLLDLRARGLSVLIIAHELAVIYQLADYVYVLRAGEVVEHGPAQELLRRPAHPYTAVLVASTYTAGAQFDRSIYFPDRPPESGAPVHDACPYRHECPAAQPDCARARPLLNELEVGRAAACHFPFTLQPPAELFE